MKTTLLVGITGVAVLAAAGYGLHELGVQRGVALAGSVSNGSGAAKGSASAQGGVDSTNGRKVLYWQDPMVPGQRFDKPGKSPFMDMPLVPVYADSGGDAAKVSIDPRVQQNLGVRTAEVKRGVLAPALEAVGSVAYNERDVALVQARANGFLERLYVRAPLDPVRKGQALAQLYVPDWVAAQEEYLTARRIADSGGANLSGIVEGARQRMRLVGMSDAQIRAVESSGSVQARMTVTAPIGGVVGELAAREGMTVMAGAPLFRLNGLSTVWVNAEVPESAAARVRPGNAVTARAQALPGESFKGSVSAILPEVNPATRTLKARIELANPGGRLVPGMFVTVAFAQGAGREVLLVPTESVIQTGKRSVVVVTEGDGRFTPIDVEIGLDADGRTEIRSGLQPGQKVVVSGQFLVDSEANLKASATRMSETAPAVAANAARTHRGEGVVESIDRDEIVISHGPIPSLNWSAMTMGFRPPASGLPAGIAVGDTVNFDIRTTSDGAFEIVGIARARGAAAAPPAGSESAHAGHSGAPALPAAKP
ncbi:MAG TPA: efflux RND transporter periplasmic adaptor subunit [Casimicrobiaceae bacterium]